MSEREISFIAERLRPLEHLSVSAMQSFIKQFPSDQGFLLALSGGVDSCVLLDLCCRSLGAASKQLRAIHVNHGLQPEAHDWAMHCKSVCASYGVPIVSVKVDAKPNSGESPEEVARDYRRRAFANVICDDEVLLVAQHADDQIETLLLQLFRGAGVTGLAAMPLLYFADYCVVRPMLTNIKRHDILEYAQSAQLSWIDDPSNEDTSVPRNFLRHEILPKLLEHWPGLHNSVARSSRHLAEANDLLDTQASHLVEVMSGRNGCLLIPPLMRISRAEQRLVLRYWIVKHGFRNPSAKVLERIIDELLTAALDRNPLVAWKGAEVRRFRSGIFLMSPLPTVPPKKILWEGQWRQSLGKRLGCLVCDHVLVDNLMEYAGEFQQIMLVFSGNYSGLKLYSHGIHKSLKQIFQQAEIPAWIRPLYPLLMLDDELIAVPGLALDSRISASKSVHSGLIRWQDYELGWKGSD